jgi:DNA sulfur modification protein DndD
LERLIGEQNAKLREIERDLEQVKSEIDHYQRIVLQNDSPVFKRLEVELRTLEALEDTFARAVDLLTDELRKEVEAHASEIFRKLTTDPTYAGLRINENYGLTILDHDGLPVPQRSAGAEQIVALSLLGAINRMATKRGPVIMDTPFGRLDRGHRANILRYVPTMADQVVLLVHDGEVDRERDLKEIQPLVDAEYRIEHPTSTSSELVPEPVLSRA